MVILNSDILICKNSMINSIENIMYQVMKKYFEDEILCKSNEGKQKIMKNIIKEKINETKTNHFWYINTSDSVCTYIHKRGKKEGYMCHKKIKTNIGDNKPDYLCSTHSKIHIPKKRILEKVKKFKKIKKIKKN